MISQDTVETTLRTRLAAWVTAATVNDTDEIVETVGAVYLNLLAGATARPKFTAQGHSSKFMFDVLIYFKGTSEDMTAAQLRTAMALAESQVGDFVEAEGGNKNSWNSVDYAPNAPNDQIQLMAEQLDALRIITLEVTIY